MTGNYFLVKSVKTMKTFLIALLDAKCFFSLFFSPFFPLFSLETRSSDLNRYFGSFYFISCYFIIYLYFLRFSSNSWHHLCLN